jgi:hypothetical protein
LRLGSVGVVVELGCDVGWIEAAAAATVAVAGLCLGPSLGRSGWRG